MVVLEIGVGINVFQNAAQETINLVSTLFWNHEDYIHSIVPVISSASLL